jgi:hypothetical protein
MPDSRIRPRRGFAAGGDGVPVFRYLDLMLHGEHADIINEESRRKCQLYIDRPEPIAFMSVLTTVLRTPSDSGAPSERLVFVRCPIGYTCDLP